MAAEDRLRSRLARSSAYRTAGDPGSRPGLAQRHGAPRALRCDARSGDPRRQLRLFASLHHDANRLPTGFAVAAGTVLAVAAALFGLPYARAFGGAAHEGHGRHGGAAR